MEKCFCQTDRACRTGSFESGYGVPESRPEHNQTFFSISCSESGESDRLSRPLGLYEES